MLTDGFAFRLLLATERDAAMQQMALEMAGRWLGMQRVGARLAHMMLVSVAVGKASDASLAACGVCHRAHRR